MNNRREFLKHSLAGGILCSSPVAPVLASRSRKSGSKPVLACHEWQQFIGSRFTLVDASGDLQQLLLFDLQVVHLDAQSEQFDLCLRSVGRSVDLAESSYVLQHAEVGQHVFFLQPGRSRENGSFYRACLNQLISV